MSMTSELKEMMARPADKSWVKAQPHKGKALERAKIQKKPVRMRSEAEQKAVIASFPKSSDRKEPNHSDYQKKYGRAYND